jgi:hypothetical protein
MDGRKHSVIEAGGKVYNLRASFNAMAMFEENIGPIQMLTGKEAKTIVGFRGLVWATANACGTSITLDQAGDICEDYADENGYEAFVKKMQSVINESGWMGNKNGADTKNAQVKPKNASKKLSETMSELPTE